MPDIEGLEFEDYAFREFPKILYAGGVLADSEGAPSETCTVSCREEEAEALDAGFAPYIPEELPYAAPTRPDPETHQAAEEALAEAPAIEEVHFERVEPAAVSTRAAPEMVVDEADQYPDLSAKQEAALDRIPDDGVTKPGGSVKGGNKKAKK